MIQKNRILIKKKTNKQNCRCQKEKLDGFPQGIGRWECLSCCLASRWHRPPTCQYHGASSFEFPHLISFGKVSAKCHPPSFSAFFPLSFFLFSTLTAWRTECHQQDGVKNQYCESLQRAGITVCPLMAENIELIQVPGKEVNFGTDLEKKNGWDAAQIYLSCLCLPNFIEV